KKRKTNKMKHFRANYSMASHRITLNRNLASQCKRRAAATTYFQTNSI
ncbi:hypothetical protein DOY81_009542, partial [Sarcophaga bullata]